jgi:hypothetical protein
MGFTSVHFLPQFFYNLYPYCAPRLVETSPTILSTEQVEWVSPTASKKQDRPAEQRHLLEPLPG